MNELRDINKIIDDHRRIIAAQERIIADQQKQICKAKDFTERIIKLLSTAIELRDPYTKGHSDLVAEVTSKIAKNLFSNVFPDINLVTYGALLHDIGKVAISETVLNKPTRLTQAEFEMIKLHTTLGAKLVEPVAIDKLFTEAILFHHEDFDGGGYPKGLRGRDIPLIARIIRVADYFEALTSDRPYRRAMEVEKALEVMNKNSHCFDPEIFGYFINNLDQLTMRCP